MKPGRKKGNVKRKAIGVRLPPHLLDEVDLICRSEGITRTDMIIAGLKAMINESNKED